MTKLNATDAGFLYAETPVTPMSIASVQLLELPEGVTADAFIQSLKTYMSQRAHLVPYLTNKVQWADGWLDHPNWITDPHFDINNHIYEVAVAAPGSQRQLEQTVAQLHEQPLSRHRPLWDIAVLTGLADGRIAYYNRVHHACLDGMAAQASTQMLMDTEPSHGELKTPLPATAGPSRSNADHVLGLLESLASQAVDAFTGAPARAMARQRLWQRSLDPSRGLGAYGDRVPATILNRSIDKGRTYAMGELPMDMVKNLSKCTKSTLNDVFVSLCGGALRRYLLSHGALPSASLVAGCPVSLRKPGDKSANNQVAMMKVTLDTLEDDPVARLQTVSQSARTAKQVLADGIGLLPGDVTAPGMGAGVQGLAMLANVAPLAEWANPSVNVVISNVPGPRKRLYSNGARVLTHYPVSIPAHGNAVNITVQSYAGQLYFGVTACAKTMPDADRLRDELLAEYTSLVQALSAEVVALNPQPAAPAKAGSKAAAAGEENLDEHPRVA